MHTYVENKTISQVYAHIWKEARLHPGKLLMKKAELEWETTSPHFIRVISLSYQQL